MFKMDNKLSDSSISISGDDFVLKQGNDVSITIDDNGSNDGSDITSENCQLNPTHQFEHQNDPNY